MFIANFTKPFEIAFRRQVGTDGAPNRLDDTGRDRVAPISIAETLQVFRQFDTVLAFVAREFVFRKISMAHMHDTRNAEAVHLTVLDHTTHGEATEIDAMITLLSADEAKTLSLPLHSVVEQRDL